MSSGRRLGLQAVAVMLMGLGSMAVPRKAHADPNSCSSPEWCWMDCSAGSACSSGNPRCYAWYCTTDGICYPYGMLTIHCYIP